ncbi:MAG: hypothetical protein FJ125_03585, partial [Deltaproteobacteria bacterium]|nr:hypothetical protein [Deltaproteobacteria bacterium]
MDDTGAIDTSPSFSEPLALELTATSGTDTAYDLVPTPEPFLDWLDRRSSPGLGNGIGIGPSTFADRLCSGLTGTISLQDPLERMGGTGILASQQWLSYLAGRLDQAFRTYSWAGFADISFLPIEAEEGEFSAEELLRLQREEKERQEREKHWYVPWTLFGEEEAPALSRRRKRAGRTPAAHQQASRNEAHREVIRQRAEEQLRRTELEEPGRPEQLRAEEDLRQERLAATRIAAEEQRRLRLAELARREQELRQEQERRRQQELERAIRREEEREQGREQARAQRQLARLVQLAQGIPDRRLTGWLSSLVAAAAAPTAAAEPVPERLIDEAARQVEQAHRQMLVEQQRVQTARPGEEQAEAETREQQYQRSLVQRRLERLAGEARALPDRQVTRWVEALAAQAADPRVAPPDERTVAGVAERITEARLQLRQAREELESGKEQARRPRTEAEQARAAAGRADAARTALLGRLNELASLAAQIEDEGTQRWVASLAAAAGDAQAPLVEEQVL